MLGSYKGLKAKNTPTINRSESQKEKCGSRNTCRDKLQVTSNSVELSK